MVNIEVRIDRNLPVIMIDNLRVMIWRLSSTFGFDPLSEFQAKVVFGTEKTGKTTKYETDDNRNNDDDFLYFSFTDTLLVELKTGIENLHGECFL